MTQREELISVIYNDKSYMQTCVNISRPYSEDIFQEVCEQILTIPENRLPDMGYLQFWFYCVARNTFSKKGKIGKYVQKDFCPSVIETDEGEYFSEGTRSLFNRKDDTVEMHEELKDNDQDFTRVERIMLGLTEFENRIVLLFIQLGNMKKVQRETGISYSALRAVKDKIKTIQ